MNLARESTISRGVFTGLALIAFGIGLVAIAQYFLQGNPVPQGIVRDVGGFLIASVALSAVWEIVTKRAFLQEVLTTLDTSESVWQGGIERVFEDFDNDINWDELFDGITKFELFISYGRTWRTSVAKHLINLSERQGVTVRILLPNSHNKDTMAQLAHRFGMAPEELSMYCADAEKQFREIFENKACTFELILVESAPVYTYYRLGNRVLVPFYKNQRKRGTVPAILVHENGFLFKFFTNDFSALLKEDRKK